MVGLLRNSIDPINPLSVDEKFNVYKLAIKVVIAIITTMIIQILNLTTKIVFSV